MGLLSGLFGKKPKLPEFKPVDLDKEQLAQIGSNLKALPEASRLTKESQAADQETLLQGLRAAIPNYDRLISSEQSIIEQFMGGELPKSVQDRLQNRRAALGLAQGVQGSDANQYSYARDLGISELDLVQRGAQMADAHIQRQSRFMAAPMSVSSMFFTPQQRLAHLTGERDSKYKADVNAANMASMPSPGLGGLFNMVGKIGGFDYGKASGGASKSIFGTALKGITGFLTGGPVGAAVGSSFLGGGGGSSKPADSGLGYGGGGVESWSYSGGKTDAYTPKM